MFNAHTNFYDERGGFMLSRRTKFRAGIGVSVGCAGLAIGLLGAPSAMAGGGCANGGADIGSLSKGQARDAIVCEINAIRNPNVTKNSALQRAAQKHSKVMRNKDCFEHECPGEDGLGERVKDAGYVADGDAFKVGECIAYGSTSFSPADFVDAWLDDAAHRKVLKKSAYNDVGVGIDIADGTALITADLGAR